MPISQARLSGAAGTDGLGIMRTAVAHYDFAVHGGAIGTINLGVNPGNAGAASAFQLPIGAVIVDAMTDVVTAVTSGGAATFSLGCNTTTDLQAATVLGTVGTTGRHDLIPVGTAATTVKLTAARNVQMVIAAATLTAGKFTVMIRYFVSL